ncbi:hypothetical protein EV424DRAFT_287758 [Suillus variegatus]|nr:hypothetical protein EV424DRAFT_287758 [Suillus variegatus]
MNIWTFYLRQLFASFDGDLVLEAPIFSPDSLRLACTFYDESNVYVHNPTPVLLAKQSTLPKTHATLQHLLESDTTRRHAVVRRTSTRRPVIVSSFPRHQIHSPTIDHQQPIFLRHVRKLFYFTSRTNSVPPLQPRDLWHSPATSPLPPSRSASPQAATQFDDFEMSSPSHMVERFQDYITNHW